MNARKLKKELVLANQEQSFALYEQQYALLDGIFEPTRRGEPLHYREIIGHSKWRHPETGEVYENAIDLKLYVPSVLNPQAESILLAIIKMSSQDGLRIDPDQPMLPMFSIPKDNAAKKDTVQTCCTKYKLLQAAGMGDDDKSYKLLDFYLEKMSLIGVIWKNNLSGWKGNSWFLSYASHNDGRLIIRLNWRLAGAIFGEYEYAKIDLNERHALEKDPSKTLHRWLSAHLWAGRSEYITYDKLVGHVWTRKATKKTQQKRIERLRNEILTDIASLDKWEVELRREGVLITHLKDPKYLSAEQSPTTALTVAKSCFSRQHPTQGQKRV